LNLLLETIFGSSHSLRVTLLHRPLHHLSRVVLFSFVSLCLPFSFDSPPLFRLLQPPSLRPSSPVYHPRPRWCSCRLATTPHHHSSSVLPLPRTSSIVSDKKSPKPPAEPLEGQMRPWPLLNRVNFVKTEVNNRSYVGTQAFIRVFQSVLAHLELARSNPRE
jgi:hypothetical protein